MRPPKRRAARIAATVLAFVCALSISVAADESAPPSRQDPVARDISRLKQFHQPAKSAARRLIEIGPVVVPRLHQALLDPASNDHQRVQLISVLAQIGEAASVDVIVQAANTFREQPAIRADALMMLGDLPQTPAALALANRVLEDPDDYHQVKRRALAYFGIHRDERGRRWISAYRDDPEADLRAAALFLAARLGDVSSRQSIVDMLAGPPPRSLRHGLLMALAEVAGPEEMARLTPEYLLETAEYAGALRVSAFRTAAPGEKESLARDLLGSTDPYARKIGAGHLADELGVEALRQYLGDDVEPPLRAVAMHQVRRAGYRIRKTRDGEIQLERKGSQ